MTKIKIPSYEAYKYNEVWEVTQASAGAMTQTRFTGKYIKVEDIIRLDAGKYLACSISLETQRQSEIELPMFFN
jgi:hypothetical protein